MRIAIDISPISKTSNSAHKVRGVGSYINMLVENLPQVDKVNQYRFVEDDDFSKADIVHYPYFDPFFKTLPFNLKTKFIVTVHDLTPLVFHQHFPTGIKGKINWYFQRMNLRKSSYVVVDSNCSGKDVENIVGINESIVKTVYLAADKQFREINDNMSLSRVAKKYNLPDNFLLYVGDATWNKNLPRLIEAVKNTNHKLVIVGKVWETKIVDRNPWNDDLRSVLLGIRDNNQFINLGFVPEEDIVPIYNLATSLIMPSIYEGFGLPILEAMNSGCPVISSRGGSLPEIGGEAVLYIDELNVESIFAGINKMFSDVKLREDFTKKGLSQAKKFSIDKSIRDLVLVYNSVFQE